MSADSAKSAVVYTPLTLKLYDWWVLSISNRYAWRCPTDTVLLPHFQRHMGIRHLDIGVGTGYYLANTPQGSRQITLLDLNDNSLHAASARVGAQRITERLRHDIFQPLPERLHGHFDSLSLFYLLHCLPGSMAEKQRVIHHAASALTPDGVLFGATILGHGVEHNAFGRKLMAVYNKKGIFGNQADSRQQLHDALARQFMQVEVQLHGTVAVFTARQKKPSDDGLANAITD